MPTSHYRVTNYGVDAGGNFFQNVLFYEVSDPTVGDVYGALADFLQAWATALTDEFLALMPSTAHLHAVKAAKIDPEPTSASLVLQNFADGASLNLGEVGAIALNLKLLSPSVSGRNQGHLYVAALHNQVFADDQLVATVPAAALGDALVETIEFGAGGTADLCIRNRQDETYAIVEQVIPQSGPATLPRRLRPFG